MSEEHRLLVGYDGANYVLCDGRQGQHYPLAEGSRVEVFLGGKWCPVQVASGGYRGWYYLREDGRCERFAVGMWGRFPGRAC